MNRNTKTTKTPDATATTLLVRYVVRFSENRGLRPTFPRLVVAISPSLAGFAVRNADGGVDIAFFSTRDLAEKTIRRLEHFFRAENPQA
jgi:hypothetical protein